MNRVRVLVLVCGLAWAGFAAGAEVEDLLARAQQGDSAALTALRMRLSEGPGSAADIERVVEGNRAAAVKGEARAQYEYAYLLEQGLGIARDYRQAETWYGKAAAQGHVDAQYRLGRMYHEGAASGADRRQAYAWLAVAAAGGSAAAARLLERAAATLAPGDLAKAKVEAEALTGRLAAAPTPG